MEGARKAGEGVIRLDQATNPESFDFTVTEEPEKGEIVRVFIGSKQIA
jgi:hypothetical protein